MTRKQFSQLIIFLIVAIDLLGFAIVLPLLPRYGLYYHASEITLGLLMSCFSAMQFLFAPLWGRISDRIGRRPVLLIGLFGSTFFYGIFGWISTFSAEETFLGYSALTWLFLSRMGAGISGATISTAQAYISDTTTREERGKGMALIGAAFGIGFTFGPLIGAPFVSDDPTAAPGHWPGLIASCISGVAFLLAVARLPESLNENSKPAERRWLSLRDAKLVYQHPTIAPLLVTIFIATFAFAQFEMTLPYMTKLIGLSDRHNFYIFAYIGLLLTLFQGGLVRRLIPKLGVYRVGIMGAVCLSVGLLLISWVANSGSFTSDSGSFTRLMVVLPVSVLGFSAITPSLQAMLSLGAGDTDQGEVLGIGQSMSALARICGPIAGYGLLELGYNLMPYLSGAVLMLVTAGMLNWIQRSHPEIQREHGVSDEAMKESADVASGTGS
ncbi:MAG: MFS transporter [Planctomycetaceae bacterium]|nr:MFS transporter [Planctomycetaceae bacterium]